MREALIWLNVTKECKKDGFFRNTWNQLTLVSVNITLGVLWLEHEHEFSPGAFWGWITPLYWAPGCWGVITFWTPTHSSHELNHTFELSSAPSLSLSFLPSVCKAGDPSLPLSIVLWRHYCNLQSAEIFQRRGSLTDTSPIPQRYLPFSFSPNIVRKTVKLMGPGASFTMSSSSSFLTFRRPAAEIIFHNKSQIVFQKMIPIHLLPLGSSGLCATLLITW